MVQEALAKWFGHPAFLPGQEEVVQRISGDEDLCVLMPTGAGKSLCYQLPALMKPGYTIVISPLISLMKDQVDQLQARNIPAAFINSTQRPEDRRKVEAALINGSLKLLYIAPERLRSKGFKELVAQHPPNFLVVDEAHCISQWGHDFRPDYAKIGKWVEGLQIERICAFTATATPRVRKDILSVLKRPNMETFVTGFIRPNLSFKVTDCYNDAYRLAVIERLLKKKEPTIIYCSSRKNVDLIAGEFGALRYHAGMSDDERKKAQDDFMSVPCPVIAATNAFGMGIDRPDIRRVIHYNMPGSLEAYYQEAGRAGRDGKRAECILLHRKADRYIHEFFIEMSHPSKALVVRSWEKLQELAKQQETGELNYTLDELSGMIDGCKGDMQLSAVLNILQKNGLIERGFRGQHLGTLRRMRKSTELKQTFSAQTQRGLFLHRFLDAWPDAETEAGISCNAASLSDLTGLSESQVMRVIHALDGKELSWEAPFAGRGINVPNADITLPDIDFSELRKHERLERGRLEDMASYPDHRSCRQVYIVSYFGQDTKSWTCNSCDNCCSPKKLRHEKKAAKPKSKVVKEVVYGAGQDDLFESLRKLRLDLSRSRGVPAYRVFSDRSLEALAAERPTSIQEALKLPGIGPSKKRDLPQFLNHIESWRKENI